MRYSAPSANDWALVEVSRNGKRPCSDAVARIRKEADLVHVLSQLRLLMAAGHPARGDAIRPLTEKAGTYSGGGQKRVIFVLKAKPSPWRLYYFTDAPNRRFVFLDAVSKKNQKRESNDIGRACRLIRALHAGEYELKPFPLPAG